LECLNREHEEAIMKLKHENTTMELEIQSCNEIVLEMAAEMGLDRMGEDDDDDDKGDAAEPAAATPEVVAEEEEDPEMLILEQESPKKLEIILSDEEPEPLLSHLWTMLMSDHEESLSRVHDDLDNPTLDNYDEEDFYPDADD
jgi:hypothetical protein